MRGFQWVIQFILAFRSIIAGMLVAILGFIGYQTQEPVPIVIAIVGVAWLYYASADKGGREDVSSGNQSVRIPDVSFQDIAGHDRVKQELQEAVAFLLPNSSVERYGIRPLRGVLVTGPPGTGKTMLAKAIANEASSYFFPVSGSQFVEKYVGVGANRVREIFQQARSLAAKGSKGAVIFIDEIDAMGGKRSEGQHREYDQTLNQLLVEMDGIHGDKDAKILVVAATNYKEILDAALLRPGRFDRHIAIQLPDHHARAAILETHMCGKPVHPDVDISYLAKESFGFSGAQLESWTNEAAVYAMRAGTQAIEPQHFKMALNKVMIGERSDKKISAEEKRRVAVHEVGHALIAEKNSPGSVAYISLQPRDRTLGYVRRRAGQDRSLWTEKELQGNLEVIMAGPAAEEMVFGQISSGAKGDYEQAFQTAREMIMAGWSELGIVDPDLVPKGELHTAVQNILKKTFTVVSHKLASMRYLLEASVPYLLQEENLDGKEFRKHLLRQSVA